MAPESRPGEWIEPRREYLLVLAHDPELDRKIATLQPLALEPKGPAIAGKSMTIPALPSIHWPGGFRVVAAHGGGERFVVGSGEEPKWTLELRSLSDDPSVVVEVGEQPATALHMVGERVFVGQGNRVLTVDFSAPSPQLQELHQRPNMPFKGYDLFTRDDAWLITIDDILVPVYADSFELVGDDTRHLAGFQLPTEINGSYQFAVLHARGPGVGTLHAIIPYHHQGGWGHHLIAVPMQDAAPAVEVEELIDSDIPGIAVLNEHVPGSDENAQLLAGARFTPWLGLAHVEVDGGGLVLIATGDRGLWAVPDDFESNAKPQVLDIGGACFDVLTADERVFVLRGPIGLTEEQAFVATLVELSIHDGAAQSIATVELDGPYRSFVH